MKAGLTFILSFSISILFCQPLDKQWYIADDLMRKENKDYLPSTITNAFSISDETYPALSSPGGTYLASQEPRNDFLLIFDNGNFIFRSDTSPGFGSDYNFSSGTDIIKFMYLTNGYEGDNPRGKVSSGSVGGRSINSLPDGTLYESPGAILRANQDITKHADVTFIIDRRKVERCRQNSFNLCFDNLMGDDGERLSDYVSVSNVFDGPIFKGTAVTFDNNCLTGINLDPVSDYCYIALHFGEIQPFLEKEIRFKLMDESRICNETLSLSVRDSHDPNFVEVKCISKGECGKHYVRYYMQCQNETPTPAGDVTIEFTLPQVFASSSILYEKGNSTRDIQYYPNYNFNLSRIGATIKATFSAINLVGADIAFAEFCVPIIGDFSKKELLQVDLFPVSARTIFDNTEYSIQNYIDPARIEENQPELNMDDGPDLSRTTFSVNGCDCELCESITQPSIWQRIKAILSNLFGGA